VEENIFGRGRGCGKKVVEADTFFSGGVDCNKGVEKPLPKDQRKTKVNKEKKRRKAHCTSQSRRNDKKKRINSCREVPISLKDSGSWWEKNQGLEESVLKFKIGRPYPLFEKTTGSRNVTQSNLLPTKNRSGEERLIRGS